MEAIRVEAVVEEGGVIRVPLLPRGERVELIVLRPHPMREARANGSVRVQGWAKGIVIQPDFDDPIPGLED